jgi:hypothetical protein
VARLGVDDNDVGSTEPADCLDAFLNLSHVNTFLSGTPHDGPDWLALG